MRSSTCGQMELRCGLPNPDPVRSPVGVPISARSGTGTTTSTSICLCAGGATTVTGRPPARNRATSSIGRTVAESPIRWAGRSSSSSSRSRDTARCAPRLVAATAWTSSTITVSTPPNISRARLVSSRNSDSGVVIRMSAPDLMNARRSPAEVSPERTATVMSGSGNPRALDSPRIPASGERRFRSTSTASAFSGETYSTRQRRSGARSAGAVTNSSMAERNAASVLPEPVGATTSVWSPAPIASQAPTWAAVGAGKDAPNHSRTSGENRSSASSPAALAAEDDASAGRVAVSGSPRAQRRAR